MGAQEAFLTRSAQALFASARVASEALARTMSNGRAAARPGAVRRPPMRSVAAPEVGAFQSHCLGCESHCDDGDNEVCSSHSSTHTQCLR